MLSAPDTTFSNSLRSALSQTPKLLLHHLAELETSVVSSLILTSHALAFLQPCHVLCHVTSPFPHAFPFPYVLFLFLVSYVHVPLFSHGLHLLPFRMSVCPIHHNHLVGRVFLQPASIFPGDKIQCLTCHTQNIVHLCRTMGNLLLRSWRDVHGICHSTSLPSKCELLWQSWSLVLGPVHGLQPLSPCSFLHNPSCG